MIEMTCKIMRPDECSDYEIERFYHMVKDAGQVMQAGLKGRIKNAHYLAYYYEGTELAGTAAIKNTTTTRRYNLFKKAGVENQTDEYPVELGYVAVKEQYQRKGIGSILTYSLLKRCGYQKLFATVRAQNDPMKRILTKNAFTNIGNSYQSSRDDNQILLFIR